MLLYELALELNVRSTALLDRAQALGMDVDATTPLTPEQEAHLRRLYKPTRPDPPVPEIVAEAVESSMKPRGPAAILALVGAGLVVVLLIAYMLTSSGDESPPPTVAASETTEPEGSTTTTEPCDPASGIGAGAIGQTTVPDGSSGSATDLPPCAIAGGLTGDPLETTTTEAADPIDVPRDKREFCKAALSAMEFDTRLIEASDVDSLGPIRDVILEGRDRWHSDVTAMADSAPPRLDVAMDRYIRVYSNLVDTVTPETDDYQLAVHIVTTLRTDLNYYAAQINEVVNAHCDKR